MNDLERRVLRLIGENVDAPDVFTDITPVRESITDGLIDLCAASNMYARRYLLPISADRQLYRLAPVGDHILYVRAIYDRSNARQLEPILVDVLQDNDPRWLEAVGPVEAFFNLGPNLVGIYRIPSADGMLELDCICAPAAYQEDTDPVWVSPEYEEALVALAVSEYYASRGDAERAKEYLTRYVDIVQLSAVRPLQSERQYRGPT